MNRHELEAQDEELRKWKKNRGMSDTKLDEVLKITFLDIENATPTAKAYMRRLKSDAYAELAALRALNAEAMEMLRKITANSSYCPNCGGDWTEHRPDCKLNALLSRTTSTPAKHTDEAAVEYPKETSHE